MFYPLDWCVKAIKQLQGQVSSGGTGSSGGGGTSGVGFTDTDGALSIDASAADGTTQIVFDTDAEKTSGNLMEIRNHGTPIYNFDAGGLFTISPAAEGGYKGEVYIQSPDTNSAIDLYVDNTDVWMFITPNSQIRTQLWPTYSGTPYFFDSAYDKTSGALVEFRNHGTAKFVFDFQGIMTLTPITKEARNAITAAEGMFCFQSDNTPGPRFYTGGAWNKVTLTADP